MTMQIGGLSAQVTSLSQQVARLSAAAAAASQPSVTTRTYSSARTPRTCAVPAAATGPPPVPPTKPTLKLSIRRIPPRPVLPHRFSILRPAGHPTPVLPPLLRQTPPWTSPSRWLAAREKAAERPSKAFVQPERSEGSRM